MTEEKYTIEEIRRAYAAIVDDDIDSLVEELQRKEPEFVDGQVIAHNSSGYIHLYGRFADPHDFRHLTPAEVGPKYVPVEEMREFVQELVSEVKRVHYVLPGGPVYRVLDDALDALPANLRGDSDD